MAEPGEVASATTAERIAQNEATFRSANERIESAARKYETVDSIPFICECADPSCREIILLSREQYEEVRSDSTWFCAAPGHQRAAQEWGRVVADRGRYQIVAKVGRAGEVAEELDDRRS